MKASPNRNQAERPDQGLRHLLPDVALPLIGLGLAVHPDPHPQQDDGRKHRTEALDEFAIRTRDADHPRRDRPCEGSRGQRTNPAAVDVGHDFEPFRLPEEHDHRDHDQQCLQAFPQQDRGGAEECRDIAGCAWRQRHFRVVQQLIEDLRASSHCISRVALLDRAAILAHPALDPRKQ